MPIAVRVNLFRLFYPFATICFFRIHQNESDYRLQSANTSLYIRISAFRNGHHIVIGFKIFAPYSVK